MDGESSTPNRRPGGTVQPAGRATSGKRRPRQQETAVGERYELRDPFAEVTYRAGTLAEMAQHAERLGALRFHAVTPDGMRVPVEKIDGEWRRADVPEPQPVQPTKDRARRTHESGPVALPPPTIPDDRGARSDAEAVLAAKIQRLELALSERYVIKRASMRIGSMMLGQTEYRYRGDTTRIAFTESRLLLATDNNNPSVARSMVDVSEARQWQALRVSGHEEFRRMVWLEASLRGIDTLGYEPNATDRELLQKERHARQTNQMEPAEGGRSGQPAVDAAKPSERGGGGRKAVLAALEVVLLAKRVPAKQREAVMVAAADNLTARLARGETHKVKVFDKSAPVQRTIVRPTRDVQRTQDRPPPSR